MYEVVSALHEGDKLIHVLFPQAWIVLPSLQISVKKNIIVIRLNDVAKQILIERMKLMPIYCAKFPMKVLFFKNAPDLCDNYENDFLPDGNYTVDSVLIVIKSIVECSEDCYPRLLLERLIF